MVLFATVEGKDTEKEPTANDRKHSIQDREITLFLFALMSIRPCRWKVGSSSQDSLALD